MAVNAKEKKKITRDNDITTIPLTDTDQDRQFLSAEDLNLNDLRQLLLEAQKNAESAKATVTEVMTNIYSENQTQERKLYDLPETTDKASEINVEQPIVTKVPLNSYKNNNKNYQNQPTTEKINNVKSGFWHRMLGNNSASINTISENKRPGFINRTTEPKIRKELDNLTTQQNKQLYQLINNAIEEQSQKKTKNILEKAKSEIAAAQIVVDQAKREVDDAKKKVQIAKEETRRAKGAAEEAIHIARKQIESSREEMEKLRAETEEAIRLAEESIKRAQEEASAEKQAAIILFDQSKQEIISRMTEEINTAKEEARVARKAAKNAKARAEEKTYSYFHDEISRIIEQVESTKKEALEIIARSREDSKLAKDETEKVKKASEWAGSEAQEQIRKAREENNFTRKAALEEVAAMNEELIIKSGNTEESILKANKMIPQVSHDIVRQIGKEMARTRYDMEMGNPHSERVLSYTGKANTASKKFSKDDSHYIADMLHEMRAPLHSISSFARLMMEDDVPVTMTRQEFLSFLVQQSDTLKGLLDDLTSNLVAGDGRLEMNRTIVSPNELINDVIQSMRNTALEKDILIGSTIPDILPAVVADACRIKQVLINLIDNALKYNEGDSTVIIKTQIMDNKLMILVEDHGIGIPEGETPAIFDDYYRASNHGIEEGQGLGLGICKRIIESHGGHIQVQSVEGVGSTFGFTMPLAHI